MNEITTNSKKLKYVNDKGYYSLVKLLKHNGDINIICGEKGNGKSYAMKDYLLTNFINNGQKFVLLRRFDADITAYKAEWYFNDLKDIKGKFGYDNVTAHYQRFFLSNYDEKGNKCDSVEIGYYGSLATFQQRFSSIPFTDIGTIFLEEFAPKNGQYLPNEIELFEIAISTIARRKEDIKVFIVGNSFDRQSIYFREYGIDIEHQKQDTIIDNHIPHTDGTFTKVVCEYCGDEEQNKSKLIAINRGDILAGKWSVNEYPKLEEIDQFTVRYTFYIKLDNTTYECKYLVRGMDDCVYITETDHKVTSTDRCICEIASPYALHTNRLIGLSQEENYIFKIVKMGKCFYKDNLTGTEFTNRLHKIA